MISFTLRQLNKLGRPWNWIVALILGVLLISFLVWGFSQVQSCSYNKARKEYDGQSKAWATEKAKLLGQIAERDKQIEQLEAKEAALIAADKAGKKIDDALATKIDEVTKAAAAEASITDLPADCALRAERTCSKLAGLRPPIVIDCGEYKRRICPR